MDGLAALRHGCRHILYVDFSNRYIRLQVKHKDTGFIFLSSGTIERVFTETMRVRSDKRAARMAAYALSLRAKMTGVDSVVPSKELRYHGKYREIVDCLNAEGIRVLKPIRSED